MLAVYPDAGCVMIPLSVARVLTYSAGEDDDVIIVGNDDVTDATHIKAGTGYDILDGRKRVVAMNVNLGQIQVEKAYGTAQGDSIVGG